MVGHLGLRRPGRRGRRPRGALGVGVEAEDRGQVRAHRAGQAQPVVLRPVVGPLVAAAPRGPRRARGPTTPRIVRRSRGHPVAEGERLRPRDQAGRVAAAPGRPGRARRRSARPPPRSRPRAGSGAPRCTGWPRGSARRSSGRDDVVGRRDQVARGPAAAAYRSARKGRTSATEGDATATGDVRPRAYHDRSVAGRSHPRAARRRHPSRRPRDRARGRRRRQDAGALPPPGVARRAGRLARPRSWPSPSRARPRWSCARAPRSSSARRHETLRVTTFHAYARELARVHGVERGLLPRRGGRAAPRTACSCCSTAWTSSTCASTTCAATGPVSWTDLVERIDECRDQLVSRRAVPALGRGGGAPAGSRSARPTGRAARWRSRGSRDPRPVARGGRGARTSASRSSAPWSCCGPTPTGARPPGRPPATCWWTSSRTPTTPRPSCSTCWPGTRRASWWWATTTRASTASAGRRRRTSPTSAAGSPDAAELRLEVNHRSTQAILDAAAAVVRADRRPRAQDHRRAAGGRRAGRPASGGRPTPTGRPARWSTRDPAAGRGGGPARGAGGADARGAPGGAAGHRGARARRDPPSGARRHRALRAARGARGGRLAARRGRSVRRPGAPAARRRPAPTTCPGRRRPTRCRAPRPRRRGGRGARRRRPAAPAPTALVAALDEVGRAAAALPPADALTAVIDVSGLRRAAVAAGRRRGRGAARRAGSAGAAGARDRRGRAGPRLPRPGRPARRASPRSASAARAIAPPERDRRPGDDGPPGEGPRVRRGLRHRDGPRRASPAPTAAASTSPTPCCPRCCRAAATPTWPRPGGWPTSR